MISNIMNIFSSNNVLVGTLASLRATQLERYVL